MTEWNTEKEARILKKYRFTLTFRILRVVLAIIFLFGVYMFGMNILFDHLNVNKKHVFYSNLALDWTSPTAKSSTMMVHSESKLTPFLTQKISYPVYRVIGKGEEVVGELKMEKRVFTGNSIRQIHLFKPKAESDFPFYLPKHPVTKGNLVANEQPGVWERLEKVHEGTVADFAFSTDSFLSPEELFELLKPYDVEVIWMPLYTGELEKFKVSYSSSGGSEGSTLSIGQFGLSAGRTTADNYMSGTYTLLSDENLEKNKLIMLENIEELLKNESKSYYERFLGLDHLQERYDYLKKEGFLVYGAVITGPVKELLKLKEVKKIRGVRIGEMDYWNWDR